MKMHVLRKGDSNYAELEHIWKSPPLLKGTNRYLIREWRAGFMRPVRPQPVSRNYSTLVSLIRMYTLDVPQTSPRPKVWGVSEYVFAYGQNKRFYTPVEMVGPTALRTPVVNDLHDLLDNGETRWKCPPDYQEIKKRFWTKDDAMWYYNNVTNYPKPTR